MADREEVDRWFGDPRMEQEPEENRPHDHCPSCGFPIWDVKKAAWCPNCGTLKESDGQDDQ